MLRSVRCARQRAVHAIPRSQSESLTTEWLTSIMISVLLCSFGVVSIDSQIVSTLWRRCRLIPFNCVECVMFCNVLICCIICVPRIDCQYVTVFMYVLGDEFRRRVHLLWILSPLLSYHQVWWSGMCFLTTSRIRHALPVSVILSKLHYLSTTVLSTLEALRQCIA